MLFSVLIPSFNRAWLLSKCIDSVCGISHRPLQIVVVDDGSSDGTLALAPELATCCARADVEFLMHSQENGGASSARNAALAASSGDLIQWVDADDTVNPDGVDSLITFLLQRPELDAAYGLVDVADDSGQALGTMGKTPTTTDSDFFDLLWHTMGAIYRREALAKVGGWNTELTLGDDWEFSCRARMLGLRYAFVDVRVGCYLKHTMGSLTVRAFDERSCFGVIKATRAIFDCAEASGHLSKHMQQRCFNRVLVHAVELSCNGSSRAREAYALCAQIGSPSPLIRLLPVVLRVLPVRSFHRLVFNKLRNR